MSLKNGSSPKHITDVLQSSRSSSSYSSYSSYSSSKENADEKVKRKVNILLEAENPVPIIARIKSIIYIDKILTAMEGEDKGGNVINGLIQRRLEVKKQMNHEEEEKEKAISREELSKYKTKLKRLQTKLEKLLANKPLYIRERMEENGKNTIAKLENAKRIQEAIPLNLSDLEYTIYDIELYIELQERMIKELKEQVCSRILTPKQVGPICWFMATFVAMFYSQRSRKLLLKASFGWDTKDELFSLLKQVLDDKYLKKSDNEKEDYEQFSDDTFGNILSLLFEKDPKSFPYNPKFSCGFRSEIYIGKLYKLLGIDYMSRDGVWGTNTEDAMKTKRPDLYKIWAKMQPGLLDRLFN